MSDVVLRAIGCSVGAPRSIASLPWDAAEAPTIAALTEDGFANVACSDRDIATMAGEAIAACLERSGIAPADIEAVVYSTESFRDCQAGRGLDEHDALRERLLRTLLHAGLERANPYANWLSGCANFLSTLEIAHALVASGRYAKVLLVLTDRVPARSGRLLGNGAGIRGDAAVCCLVCREGTGYRVRHLLSHADLRLSGQQASANYLRQYQAMARALQQLRARIERSTGCGLDQCATVIVDNLHHVLLDLVCQSLRIGSDRLWSPLKSDFAHLPGVDGPLSLLAGERSGRFRNGDRVAMLNFSDCVFGLALLDVVRESRPSSRAASPLGAAG